MGIIHMSSEEIQKSVSSGLITIAVYGMGRVGIPIAVAWLRAGARVIGVDINESLVSNLNNGVVNLKDEPGIEEGIRKGLKEGKFKATTDGIQASKSSDVKIIVVPTVLNNQRRLDTRNLEDVTRKIGKGLKKGDVVIVECTVPPLTTEFLIKRILEEEGNLKVEEDFALAYSPERIYEGRALRDIEENYPKVVGGVGPKSTDVVAALYECVAKKGVIKLKRAREAEASKVFEGVYRDVNIALANELAKFCDSAGIDFIEARSAANSQPFCHLHLPGIGVGGLCIPIYPYFLTSVAENFGLDMRIVKQARSTNDDMPKYVLHLLNKLLDRLGLEAGKVKIGVLGLSFRGDVSDIRLSPAIEFIKLIHGSFAGVKAYDPFVERVEGIDTCKTLDELLAWADILVVATDHSSFKKLDLRHVDNRLIIVDGRNVLDPSLLPKGSIYLGIGRASSEAPFYKS
ncbi:MAG: nucleotide sugar dehydrogenase [Candidatus Methanomethyliales bacterium]|nr:nucleotide sugar dehydrogenase [Candidatus Methanomethylicales archaeon]